LRLVLFAALNGLVCALERRHQHRQLFELDDRLLDDIGISRQWAVESISRSFWIDLNVGRIEQ
jgi:uncharacterized protein YjiS (DUF1127 family)